MILRFAIRNWMSFQEEATLDLVATREKQHASHVLNVNEYNLEVLPIAAIYGANASGKSNLANALGFAKRFVINPPKAGARIPVRPFLLGEESTEPQTDFRFELLIEQSVYRYEFSLTPARVVSESLFQLHARSEEKLFERGNKVGTEGFWLSKKLEKANAGLLFAFRGTQENQLFLTNSVSQKHAEFKPIFDWFNDALIMIGPDTRYARIPEFASEKHPFSTEITKWLRNLDSGIQFLRSEEIPPPPQLPKSLIERIVSTLKEGETYPLSDLDGTDGDFVLIEDGKPVFRQLTPIHKNRLGQEVPFRFADESDGTRRLFDLLPAFFFLEQPRWPSTFVIDELDRSLHSNLTRFLVNHFLANRKDSSRTQLIFTTHDTELMSQKLLRRDEMWLAERNEHGASSLTALSEFKDVRKDKDVRKSYLQGRMGGVPRIRDVFDVCDEVETI